ncbi:DUF4035 domain-containing protein [Pasteurella atlantica]|uniref:DUF4035 domain-containing protein n=2 Tax=Pasteurellaceae TaxID=712 RepID=A0ACC6HJP8_9PAST|nr:DUF4035 domain-containing protein [Pasteurella atlantica]MDP8051054.1 DUF4035 domain-containing protein [Pasteurella atlantica]MDP8104350.1 DUF4035 domain-containing protein [Pasteurella atlantica]MDP8147710.1 DUF4035 domain-containing protein [Pasteurella atlantica]
MPEREFNEYLLYNEEQPFGQWRDDYRTAQISHLLALINRDSKREPPKLQDFMPFWNKSSIEEDEDDGSAEFLANR